MYFVNWLSLKLYKHFLSKHLCPFVKISLTLVPFSPNKSPMKQNVIEWNIWKKSYIYFILVPYRRCITHNNFFSGTSFVDIIAPRVALLGGEIILVHDRFGEIINRYFMATEHHRNKFHTSRGTCVKNKTNRYLCMGKNWKGKGKKKN